MKEVDFADIAKDLPFSQGSLLPRTSKMLVLLQFLLDKIKSKSNKTYSCKTKYYALGYENTLKHKTKKLTLETYLTQMLLLFLKTLKGCTATFKEKLKTAFAGPSELPCKELAENSTQKQRLSLEDLFEPLYRSRR